MCSAKDNYELMQFRFISDSYRTALCLCILALNTEKGNMMLKPTSIAVHVCKTAQMLDLA